MPLEGHAPDCACCVVRVSAPNKRKRTGEDANLFDFLPPGDAPVECEEEGEGEGEENLDAESIDRLISNALFAKFEQHVRAIEDARAARQELLSFKSALEDEGNKAEVSADASLDERDMLGVRMPGDHFQGDTNMRTLQKLLTRVDQRGFERSSQQLEARSAPHRFARMSFTRVMRAQFHEAFLKAAARVIYRGDWETEKPAIMRQNGWETSNSEVLISTPRRFGKTFSCVRRPLCPLTRVLIPSHLLGSIAIFCACLSLAFGLEVRTLGSDRNATTLTRSPLAQVVVFSPARRASRKLLERIVEFVKLAGGEKRICEYNQARANGPPSHPAAADARLRRARRRLAD